MSLKQLGLELVFQQGQTPTGRWNRYKTSLSGTRQIPELCCLHKKVPTNPYQGASPYLFNYADFACSVCISVLH